MLMNLNTSEQNVLAWSALTPGLVNLQKFTFSERYHLTAHVNPSLSLDDGSYAMDNLF